MRILTAGLGAFILLSLGVTVTHLHTTFPGGGGHGGIQMAQVRATSREPPQQQPSSSSVVTDPHNQPDAPAVITPDAGKEEEAVLVVISSDRIEGILPALASILRSTVTAPVHVVLIESSHQKNDTTSSNAETVRTHFGSRIAHFISLTVSDVQEDLIRQSRRKTTRQTESKTSSNSAADSNSILIGEPIWMWPEWHSSIHNSSNWSNLDYTIRPDVWDNRLVHAHELNHVRFYLPHLSFFAHRDYLYFVDDDVIVQQDLSVLATQTLETLSRDKGLVTPCSMWTWNDECQTFGFAVAQATMEHSTPIYGDRKRCETDAEINCVPALYHEEFVSQFLPPNGTLVQSQLAWNFGFSLFALRHWRELQLTRKYEEVMRESYRLHVYPETSLAFGLGVPFIALAGAVECWDDAKASVRDGFGFMDNSRLEETFGGKDYMKEIGVIHYTGTAKPWEPYSLIGEPILRPWLETLEQEGLTLPPQLPTTPTHALFTLIGSSHTDTDRIMRLLDSHPHVCASGESDTPEIGFPSNLLDPGGISWYPTCSIKKGCTLAFVRDSIWDLCKDYSFPNSDNNALPQRCHSMSTDDPLLRHLPTMCNFVTELGGNFSLGAIARVWVEAYQKEDKRLLRCGCKRGSLIKGVSVMPEWLAYVGYPAEYVGPAPLDLNSTILTKSKVIRIQRRRSAWARVKSRLLDEVTQIWNPQTVAEKANQLNKLEGDLTVDTNDIRRRIQTILDMERAGDEWAKDHSSYVLWVDYDDCRKDAVQCIDRIAAFLEVDLSGLTTQRSDLFESMFSPVELDNSLDFIQNKQALQEILDEFESDFNTHDAVAPS